VERRGGRTEVKKMKNSVKGRTSGRVKTGLAYIGGGKVDIMDRQLAIEKRSAEDNGIELSMSRSQGWRRDKANRTVAA